MLGHAGRHRSRLGAAGRAAVAGQRVAKSPGGFVVADEVGAGVLENGQLRVGEQGFGLPGCSDHPGEPFVLESGGVNEAPGGWTGDALACLDGFMNIAEVLGGAAGGLNVKELVNPSPRTA